MPADCYLFGEFTVDLSRASLLHAGTQVPLRPKSFDLLCYLLQRAGRLAGKDELLSAIWPEVVVTEDSLTRCVSEVRAAIGDGHQQLIKTVPKRGYVFTATVRELDSAADSAPPSAPEAPSSILRSWAPFGVASVALAIIAAASFAAFHRGSADPPRLSIVVLPFASLGADPKQAYIADVVTDDLTSAMARLRGATVISASSAFAFKGKPVELRELGDELKVRYALQGAVHRRGAGISISARLTDARSGQSLWSDQFEINRADLSSAQDDIVVRIANALDAELVVVESKRSIRRSAATLDAEDLAMQCDDASSLQQGESGAPSYELCERALQLDPGNVRALVRLALYYADRVERVQSPDPQADLARASDWAARALAVDPRYYGAHCASAVVLAAEHWVREAVAAAERCRSLNPSHARAYRILATLHFFLGEPEKTLAFAERGMRLSPRDVQIAAFLLFKGWGYFMMGNEEEALVWMRKAAAASPDSPSILAPLASVLALTGREAEARAMLAHYLSLKRTRTRTISQWDHRPDGNPMFLRLEERFKSGLRKAGMPER
jgi:adenylate cyclase